MTAAEFDGVAHQITHGPSFAMLRVDLQPGQTVSAEAGAMVARHASVTMDVSINADRQAGFLATVFAFFVALIRKVVGGETFFITHFHSATGGSVWIAPTMSGQVQYRRMRGGPITLSAGAYVASAGDVRMKLKFGGLRSILAKEGAFFIEASGEGDLWFTSYGGVHAIDVDGSYMIDNGHLVGYEGNLSFTMASAGSGIVGFMASGEGMVCEFRGQGRVYIQSRNPQALVGWLEPLLPA